MKKEKLTEELTEKISGGADLESDLKKIHDFIESNTMSVKCAKCGKEFKYYKDEPNSLSMRLDGPHGFWAWDAEKRTCPSCGYVNSEKELGLRKK